MILGMSLHAFTVFHVVLSLIGILTGFIVVFGMFRSEANERHDHAFPADDGVD